MSKPPYITYFVFYFPTHQIAYHFTLAIGNPLLPLAREQSLPFRGGLLELLEVLLKIGVSQMVYNPSLVSLRYGELFYLHMAYWGMAMGSHYF